MIANPTGAALIVAVFLTLVAGAPPEISDSKTESLDTFLTERESEGLAFVLVVSTGGGTVFAGAYGEADRKRDLPVQIDTAFDIGSISKTFTSAAVYQLADEGRLKLDDTIDVHLDGVPGDKAPITLEQLIEHRSGLPQYHDRKGDFERMSRDKALERILDAELVFEPGERYAYSNAGYTLLAIIVEEVTGKPFREVCREWFFEPLGMSHTGFYGDRELWDPDRVATGYGDSREGKNSPFYWRQDDLWAVVGNGGIVSTTDDLLKWAAARESLFPSPEPPPGLGEKREFSRGWYLATRPLTGLQVFHGGAIDKGFIAMLRDYPEHDTTLVVLSNTYRAGEPHIRNYLDEVEDILFAQQD